MHLRIFIALFVMALVALAPIGCKRGGSSSSSTAFQSASPELKTAWERAGAAAKTNDYATAILTYQAMRLQPNLTPQQETAINDAAKEVDDRMYDAANKGDAQAKAALETLRNARGR